MGRNVKEHLHPMSSYDLFVRSGRGRITHDLEVSSEGGWATHVVGGWGAVVQQGAR